MKKRLFGMLTAAVLAAASVPSFGVSAADYSYRQTGENDDFMEGWSMECDGADYESAEQPDGSLKAEWHKIWDCLSQNGKSYEQSITVPEYLRVSYDMELGASGICFYGAACWLDLGGTYLECNVVEGWNDWRPPGNDDVLESVEIDGVQYDVFITYRQTSVPGDFEPRMMPQFWSVRQENTFVAGESAVYKGTVSLDQHLKEWKKLSNWIQRDDLKIKIVSAAVNAWGGNNESGGRYDANGACRIQRPVISTEAPGKTAPVLTQSAEQETDRYLKDVFAPYFRLGGVYNQESAAYQEIYSREFSALTPQSAMFPSTAVKSAEGKNVTMDFSGMDGFLSYAEQNRIPVCGSAFLTTGLLMSPEELFDCTPEEGNARIESMIQQTFAYIRENYPNLELFAYTVCDQIDSADAYGWGSVFGEDTDYVVQAFKAARKYAPEGCKLYLSDGLRNADAFELAKALMQENCLDGIALKAISGSEFSADDLEQRIKKYTALGLDVQITDAQFSLPQDYQAEATGEVWKEFFTVAMNNAEHISCVTVGKPFSNPYMTDEQPGGFFRVTFNADKTEKIEPFKSYYDVLEMMQAKQAESGSTKTGDANCDGTVDVADAVLVLRYAISDAEAVISDQGVKNGDADKNGKTDPDDAALILKYIARKVTL